MAFKSASCAKGQLPGQCRFVRATAIAVLPGQGREGGNVGADALVFYFMSRMGSAFCDTLT